MDDSGTDNEARPKQHDIMAEKGFRFLDLPPELRNRVYFHMESLVTGVTKNRPSKPAIEVDGRNLVSGCGWYCYYGPSSDTPKPRQTFPIQPSITRVCRQIRQETLPIFYGANHFSIVDCFWPDLDDIDETFSTVLFSWLDRNSAHIPLFKHLEVRCCYLNAQRAHELVASMTDRYHDFEGDVLKAYDL